LEAKKSKINVQRERRDLDKVPFGPEWDAGMLLLKDLEQDLEFKQEEATRLDALVKKSMLAQTDSSSKREIHVHVQSSEIPRDFKDLSSGDNHASSSLISKDLNFLENKSDFVNQKLVLGLSTRLKVVMRVAALHFYDINWGVCVHLLRRLAREMCIV